MPGTLLRTFQVVIYLIFMAALWNKHFYLLFKDKETKTFKRGDFHLETLSQWVINCIDAHVSGLH